MSGKRLMFLFWIANFATLLVYQGWKGRTGWAFFNSILLIIGVWIYVESIVHELKSAKGEVEPDEPSSGNSKD